jgi:hypothetical protein
MKCICRTFGKTVAKIVLITLFLGTQYVVAETGAEQNTTAATAATAAERAAAAASKSAVTAASQAVAAAVSVSSTAAASEWNPPGTVFLYLVPILVFFGSLIAIISIARTLTSSKWSLVDALSEDTEITLFKTDAQGNQAPVMDSENKKPLMVKAMLASSSRMIPLMGMVVILFLYVGFGVFALYSYARSGRVVEAMDRIIQYLVSGMTLFAPYIVNKFSTPFRGLSPRK